MVSSPYTWCYSSMGNLWDGNSKKLKSNGTLARQCGKCNGSGKTGVNWFSKMCVECRGTKKTPVLPKLDDETIVKVTLDDHRVTFNVGGNDEYTITVPPMQSCPNYNGWGRFYPKCSVCGCDPDDVDANCPKCRCPVCGGDRTVGKIALGVTLLQGNSKVTLLP